MTPLYFFKISCLSVLMLLTNACSESGSSGSPGGIDRGGVTIGTISGFGSVIVNGIKFNTDNANIFDGSDPTDESRLDVGQVVMVTGDIDSKTSTGVASSIVLTTELIGPVTAIDATNQTVTILGQLVQLNNDTLFDQENASIDSLKIGDYLRVYGLRASSEIVASRLEHETDMMNVDVRGKIESLDLNLQRFEINEQVIDYSMVSLDDLTKRALQDGLFVRVTATTLLEGVVLAEVIINETDRFKLEEKTDVELEGVIDSSPGAGEFLLSGYRVKFDAERTEIEGGDESEIVAGMRVEVEGIVNADGEIFADEIKIKTSANARIEGTVQFVDLASKTLIVEGLTLSTTETTQFLDKSDAKVRKFSLADIGVGDKVEAKGYMSGEVLIVNQLRRESADDEINLEGEVSAFSNEDIVVNGIQVLITDETQVDKDFWEDVGVGQRIKVEAMRDASGRIIAEKIKI
ncbi:MAG: hypothetical protein H7A01_11730 [Hahellaceae bacterium]|nr:hypothetical protein [Hahellaceae bacterium]MCP5210012.1 hypothetical protein [Hahellaceae bacterium]